MQTVIILNILVIIIAYFARYRKTRFLFEISFFIIFLFTALRFNFGTDYEGYLESFNYIIKSHSIRSINFNSFLFEPAWAVLNYIFKPIGFFGFIIVLSAFICYTYYFIIKKYVDPKYYWFAIFIYVFSFDIMWIQFSALRQALAIAIFIHSVKYLNEKRNPVIYILLNLLGASFHTSAYFMLPLVIFSFKKIRNSKLLGIIILAIFWGILLEGHKLIPKLMELTAYISKDSYISKFEREISTSITLIGSLIWGTLLMIIIYYSKYQKDEAKNLFYLSALYTLVYVFTPLVWLADRMGYYFAPFNIVVYPLIIYYEKRKFIKIGLIIFFIIFTLNRFIAFSKLDWVIDGYSQYKTILSTL